MAAHMTNHRLSISFIIFVMGKYSSDSEKEKQESKNSSKIRNRRRSSSSDSTDTRFRRGRDKKSSRKSKSRSRDRYSKFRRSRSSSVSTYRSSKSKSYRSKSKEKSRYRDRRRSRSRSRGKYRSRRSRSKSYIKEYVSKQKKRSSSSSSSSTSSDRDRECRKIISTKASSKNGNVIVNENKITSDSPDCIIVDSKTLEEINEDKFAPKQFTSSKSKKVPENILIDLKKNTIKIPELEPIEPDSIFHHNLFLNEEARMEKWVKELYSYRQKALQQGVKNNS